jgi:hypothetical protein
MAEEVRITVIATGFDRAGVRPGTVERPVRMDDTNLSSGASGVRARPAANSNTERPTSTSGSTYNSNPRSTSTQSNNNNPSTQQPTQNDFQRVVNTDDLDIPAFLRNRSTRS